MMISGNDHFPRHAEEEAVKNNWADHGPNHGPGPHWCHSGAAVLTICVQLCQILYKGWNVM